MANTLKICPACKQVAELMSICQICSGRGEVWEVRRGDSIDLHQVLDDGTINMEQFVNVDPEEHSDIDGSLADTVAFAAQAFVAALPSRPEEDGIPEDELKALKLALDNWEASLGA
jgi:hypothetical protein